jgi:hypothetical protein
VVGLRWSTGSGFDHLNDLGIVYQHLGWLSLGNDNAVSAALDKAIIGPFVGAFVHAGAVR